MAKAHGNAEKRSEGETHNVPLLSCKLDRPVEKSGFLYITKQLNNPNDRNVRWETQRSEHIQRLPLVRVPEANVGRGRRGAVARQCRWPTAVAQFGERRVRAAALPPPTLPAGPRWGRRGERRKTSSFQPHPQIDVGESPVIKNANRLLPRDGVRKTAACWRFLREGGVHGGSGGC